MTIKMVLNKDAGGLWDMGRSMYGAIHINREFNQPELTKRIKSFPYLCP